MTQEEIDSIAINYNLLNEKINNCNDKLILKKLKNEQNILISKLQFIVEQYTKKYKKFSNYQDLYQIGQIGLLNALKTFKIGKSSFSWWSQKYIKLMLSRSACQHASIKISLKDARETKPIKVNNFPKLSDDNLFFDNLCNKEFHSKLIELINLEANDKNKQILKLFYGDKVYQHKISEIQEKLNIKSRIEINKVINKFNEKVIEQFKLKD